jgi:hypothetical protein
MSTWLLGTKRVDLELRENAAGVIEKRSHIVIVLRQKNFGADFVEETGTKKALLSWFVGSTSTIKIGPASKKYLCVGDGLLDGDGVSNYRWREQVWEYFSPWEEEDFE